ncbi:ACP S-malonyltransferase [Staphylococcus caprae]|uniref:ACP S-malonyltransferase n=1 Tax=Staphylococcus caprae TaxID=29380 RepID=UPI0030C613BC
MKYCICFPGQGSQYIGMAKDLYYEYDIVKNTFKEASELLPINMEEVCFEGKNLKDSKFAQLSIFVTSVAMFRVIKKKFNIDPSVLVGHSLGEISALVCSNALSFEDGIEVVLKRGDLMDKAIKKDIGGMGIIRGLTQFEVEFICNSFNNSNINIACYNTPKQFAVSSTNNILEEIRKIVLEFEGEFSFLNISAPFHSCLLQSLKKPLEDTLKKIKINAPDIPVISCINGNKLKDPDEILTDLINLTCNSVRWDRVINLIPKMGIDLCIEVGPKSTLKKFNHAFSQSPQTYSFSYLKDRELLFNSFVCTKLSNDDLVDFFSAIYYCQKNVKLNKLSIELIKERDKFNYSNEEVIAIYINLIKLMKEKGAQKTLKCKVKELMTYEFQNHDLKKKIKEVNYDDRY